MSFTPPKNLLELSTDEKKKFLDSFDIVFSDIDGVVWNMDVPVDGACEGYEALKEAGKTLKFLTNNSVRPMEDLLKKFAKQNIKAQEADIIHPAQTTVDYLKSIDFQGLIFPLVSNAYKEVLKNNGFQIHEYPNKVYEESFSQIGRDIYDGADVGAVVVDFDFNFNTVKAMKAFQYLRNPKCLLIGGAIDDILPVTKEIIFMGPGPFLKLLRDMSKQPMLIMGKPGKDLGDTLMQRYSIKDARRALMIGDMLLSDVAFGNTIGFQTVLVLSGGGTLAEVEAQTDALMVPQYYINSLADFVSFMNDVKKSNF